MGRVRQPIRVDGRDCWTLFDTGARHTYVTADVARLLQTASSPEPFRTSLGGSVRETNTAAILEGDIEGHRIVTQAWVLDEIGKDEEGKPIEILFGALAMQQWGIRPLPDQEKVDLSHYTDTFVEF